MQKKNLIEKNRARAQKLIRLYMKELSSEEKLASAPLNQIAAALGTLVDKFGREDSENDSGAIIISHNIPRAKEGEDEI